MIFPQSVLKTKQKSSFIGGDLFLLPCYMQGSPRCKTCLLAVNAFNPKKNGYIMDLAASLLYDYCFGHSICRLQDRGILLSLQRNNAVLYSFIRGGHFSDCISDVLNV